MILLGLVAVLWVAVLAPSVWRRFGERQGVGSIESFHHQLQLLEHAGPEDRRAGIPAAHGTSGRCARARNHRRSPDSSRPKLVLLRPTDDAAAADVDDDEGCHYERVGVLDRPEPVCLPEVGAGPAGLRRDQARRRFSMLLRCLGGVAVSTVHHRPDGRDAPGLDLHRADGPPAPSRLVGLMAYANELKEEQRRRRGAAPGAAARRGRPHGRRNRRLPRRLGRRRDLRRAPGGSPLEPTSRRRRFRDLLERPGILRPPGV